MYKTKSKKKNTGFYIALAICIVTVAAAALTTYGSVAEYYQPQDTHTGNEISGEPYENSEPPEPSASEPAESSASEPAESSEESSQPSQESTESSVSEPSAPAESSEEMQTMLYSPVEGGEILKPFSMTTLIYAKTTNDWRTHRGTDYAAGMGTAVMAMTDGTVKSVYRDALYGETICVEHEGYTARYCGLTEKTLVHEGDSVKGGQPIGYVGTVPCEQSDDPHLHLEILSGEKFLSAVSLSASSK